MFSNLQIIQFVVEHGIIYINTINFLFEVYKMKLLSVTSGHKVSKKMT